VIDFNFSQLFGFEKGAYLTLKSIFHKALKEGAKDKRRLNKLLPPSLSMLPKTKHCAL